MTLDAEASRAPLKLALIVGEASGDALGAALMQALQAQSPGPLAFVGVGGPLMESLGLKSLFPMGDIAVMGFVPVIKRLPTLLARIRAAADLIVAAQPAVAVLIDSPDFTHRVARRVRKIAPHIPIIVYVSPTVWAWRQGRARAMRPHIDRVLALFPFEPTAYARLHGPPCTYVGHPLINRLLDFAPSATEAVRRAALPHQIVLLPGSRMAEVTRLLPLFEQCALALESRHSGKLAFVLPTLPHVADFVVPSVKSWRVPVRLIFDEGQKLAAFRGARAALAASGTVTLELALANVPTVACYRVGALEAFIARRLIRVTSVLLPNLIADEAIVPEFLQERCIAETLCAALERVIFDDDARQAQNLGFRTVLQRLQAGSDVPPATRAASAVLETVFGQARHRRLP